jgi:DNA-binding MarR family transcriptional regulator
MRLEDEIKTTKFLSEVHKAHLNILFTASWLKLRIKQRLKPFGLTMEQYNVMRIVRGQHPNSICVKEITKRMLEKNSNTTRIIDRLEQKGYMKRLASDRDRRERSIELTPAGMDLLSAIDREWEYNTPHTSALQHDEAKQLNELMEKLRLDD